MTEPPGMIALAVRSKALVRGSATPWLLYSMSMKPCGARSTSSAVEWTVWESIAATLGLLLMLLSTVASEGALDPNPSVRARTRAAMTIGTRNHPAPTLGPAKICEYTSPARWHGVAPSTPALPAWISCIDRPLQGDRTPRLQELDVGDGRRLWR